MYKQKAWGGITIPKGEISRLKDGQDFDHDSGLSHLRQLWGFPL
ncbi:hypothetical protein [Xenorhabdus sp. SGI240]